MSLELCETKTTDRSLKALIEPLSKLTDMTELSLGFGKTYLKNDKILKDFTRAIR